MRQLTFDYELDQLCDNCFEKPAEVKQLCRSCYYKNRYMVKYPDTKPYQLNPEDLKTPHDNSWFRERLIGKYGPEIIEDLNNLKTKHFWTLVEMGNKYGLSREYVRQMFVKMFGKGYGVYAAKKTAYRKADSEMSGCCNDPRHKVADYKDSKQKDGAKAELLVFNKCKKMGFNVEIPCESIFDLKINGFHVDVKSAQKEMSPYKTPGATTYYHFRIRAKQHDMCDFFICYVRSQGTFYIIPKIAIKSRCAIYIKATPSKLGARYVRTRYGKYEQYKEAWGLLTTRHREGAP